MGTPCMGFLQDEFGWGRKSSAWAFGATVFLLGLPTVLFFNYGVFDEYDYWAGTVSLVVFALFEIILFAWVFGMNKGWHEITSGADIKVPGVFKYIIKFVTPLMLAWVFISSLPGIWKQIKNDAIYTQIFAATDPAVIEQLNTQLLYVNISRIGLLLVWLGVALLVYLAYKKRIKEGRFTS
jgi:neurotransmitter:Na+ symporter, NSS family